MNMDPRTLIELQNAGVDAWQLHLFEEIIKTIYKRILTPGDYVVDGGANAGMHTFPLADAVGESGRVLAFEPLPNLVDLLRREVDARGLGQVTVRQEALSVRQGKANFNWLRNREAESSLSTARIDPGADDVESLDVDTVRLDDVLPITFDRWRFAKLDLEGAEFDALRGGQQSLMRFRPTVILEFGYHAAAKAWGYSQAEWDAFYDQIDYRLYDLVGRPILHRPWGELRSYIWYLIAVPKDSRDESFITDGLIRVIEPLVHEWSSALAERRHPRIDVGKCVILPLDR